MREYTKLYLNVFGYDTSDFIPCEVCSSRAVDIHHIRARGMGGTKKKDCIENLMALCRNCHITYGDKTKHLKFLIDIHQLKLLNANVNFSREFFV